MSNGMRIESSQLREMPLGMQEQIAMGFIKDPEKRDRIDNAISELVAALMEKYPEAVTATITITKGQVRISVALTESRVVKLAKL